MARVPTGGDELTSSEELLVQNATALSAAGAGQFFRKTSQTAVEHATPTDSGITSLNALTGTTQTFAKTDDTNVTLSITSASTSHTFALGWTGTLAVARGGTGASDASTARSNLGLAIGTNVQAYDATLASLSALGTASDKFAYTTGIDTWAEAAITAAGRAILDDADASTQRTTLGAAASGANTDITSVYLNNTGLKVKDTDASHGLSIVPGSNLSADRVLTITTGDAARTITLAGDLNIAANFSTSGANALTLTTTGSTNVTLPTSGTLATTAQYQAVSTLRKNLVAHFPMEFADANGTAANDDSIVRNNGTASNATFEPTGGPDLNGDWLFNATTSYIEIPHHVNQLLVNGLSISAWINPTSVGENNNGHIVGKTNGTSGQNGFQFRTRSSTDKLGFIVNNGTDVISANSSISFGVWQHVVVTCTSAGVANIYINGVLSGTANQTTNALSGITTTNPLRIGNRSVTDDRTFDGAIAKVRIYGRVISTAEITELYTNKL